LRLSEEDLRLRIVNGGTNMPAYGGILKKQELTAIIAFLYTRK
jgi:ubiquinol-cytochrome c reductase cytochrome b subunit